MVARPDPAAACRQHRGQRRLTCRTRLCALLKAPEPQPLPDFHFLSLYRKIRSAVPLALRSGAAAPSPAATRGPGGLSSPASSRAPLRPSRPCAGGRAQRPPPGSAPQPPRARPPLTSPAAAASQPHRGGGGWTGARLALRPRPAAPAPRALVAGPGRAHGFPAPRAPHRRRSDARPSRCPWAPAGRAAENAAWTACLCPLPPGTACVHPSFLSIPNPTLPPTPARLCSLAPLQATHPITSSHFRAGPSASRTRAHFSLPSQYSSRPHLGWFPWPMPRTAHSSLPTRTASSGCNHAPFANNITDTTTLVNFLTILISLLQV